MPERKKTVATRSTAKKAAAKKATTKKAVATKPAADPVRAAATAAPATESPVAPGTPVCPRCGTAKFAAEERTRVDGRRTVRYTVLVCERGHTFAKPVIRT